MANATIMTIPISVPNSAPMSTEVDSTACGITVLNAVAMPSMELPVIRPVPVLSTKKPIAVITVPRTTSENGFFCNSRPIIAISAKKIAPCPNISLMMKLSQAGIIVPFLL